MGVGLAASRRSYRMLINIPKGSKYLDSRYLSLKGVPV